jgi:hypothetical protein
MAKLGKYRFYYQQFELSEFTIKGKLTFLLVLDFETVGNISLKRLIFSKIRSKLGTLLKRIPTQQ